jgi:hypothetical protein
MILTQHEHGFWKTKFLWVAVSRLPFCFARGYPKSILPTKAPKGGKHFVKGYSRFGQPLKSKYIAFFEKKALYLLCCMANTNFYHLSSTAFSYHVFLFSFS